MDGKEAVAFAELCFGAGTVPRNDVRGRGVDELQNAGLAHVLDEEARLGLGLGHVRLELVLLKLGHAGGVPDRDGVVRLLLEDLGKCRLRLVELARFEQRAAVPVARIEVVRRERQHLLIQVDGLGPIGVERRMDGVIGEDPSADSGGSRCCQGFASNAGNADIGLVPMV